MRWACGIAVFLVEARRELVRLIAHGVVCSQPCAFKRGIRYEEEIIENLPWFNIDFLLFGEPASELGLGIFTALGPPEIYIRDDILSPKDQPSTHKSEKLGKFWLIAVQPALDTENGLINSAFPGLSGPGQTIEA
jgi:hypothetical protein